MVILSYAFRVFFLLGAAMSIAGIALWVLALNGIGPVANYALPALWHAHEMIIGFAAAIVAGFTLTAVAVWTGRPPLRNAPLAWLAGAWLAGRIAMLASALPDTAYPAQLISGLLDASFLVGLAFLLGREVVLAGNKRNLVVVAMVTLLAASDAVFHISMASSPVTAGKALIFGVLIILLLVTVIAGRIIPAFTANWMRRQNIDPAYLPKTSAIVDVASIAATLIAGIALALAPAHPATGWPCFAAAVLHMVRLGRWSGWRTTRDPLLFVLHAGYLWFPLGFALTGLAAFGHYPMSVALHALTMGVIGIMIFAMITRVSLGHTGRPLRAAPVIVLAYGLLFGAVLVRLSGPLFGNAYLRTIELASLGWIAVFAVFLWVYGPILASPAKQSAD